MKSISNAIEGLEEFGLICLTGEACGVGMRLLFDVTEEGRQLLQEYWGIPDLKLAPNWNSSKGATGCVMLNGRACVELCAFALLRDPNIWQVFTFQGNVIGMGMGDQKQVNEWNCDSWQAFVRLAHCFDTEEWAHQYRSYRKYGDAAGGFRCQHQMSGRVQ